MQHFLSGLPLEKGFDVKVNWDKFAGQTESCHGDAIGKIFDEVFKAYLGKVEDVAGLDAWRKIEAKAKTVSEDGTRFSQDLRNAIFTEFATGAESAIVVTPDMFQGAANKSPRYQGYESSDAR